MLRALLHLGNEHVLRPLDRKAVKRAPSLYPTTPKLVCMVSVARSGTNHLCSVLSRISELDVRHEIFHKGRCQAMREDEFAELSRRCGKVFPQSCSSPKTVDAVRRHPSLVMDCLADLRAPEKQLVYFKVFRLQLSVREVRNAILTRPDTIVVVLRRRPIDTFISLRKALQLEQWTGADTTKFKISIDADDFIGWWRRTSTWFRRVEAACWAMEKPFHRLNYEEDVDVPPERTLSRCSEILANYGMTNLTIAPEGELRRIGRQDLNKTLNDRVANWPEFEQRLSAKGFLERAFLPFPNYEPTGWDRFRHRLSTRRHALAAGSMSATGAAISGLEILERVLPS